MDLNAFRGTLFDSTHLDSSGHRQAQGITPAGSGGQHWQHMAKQSKEKISIKQYNIKHKQIYL